MSTEPIPSETTESNKKRKTMSLEESPDSEWPEAWFMVSDEDCKDQKAENRQSPNNKPASVEDLRKLGIAYWKMDASSYEYPVKAVKAFFEEHIHDAEEIRYILDGSGYFDVRDLEDKWIRIHIKKGDLMTLPEGIYHRFTCDSTDYIKAMRLFIGQPVWTPFNRPQADEHPSRKTYVESYDAVVVAEEKKEE
ncbi:MAG: hypothetical protein SGARI_002287 [Bacillariaceae sp.]